MLRVRVHVEPTRELSLHVKSQECNRKVRRRIRNLTRMAGLGECDLSSVVCSYTTPYRTASLCN